MSRSYKKTPVSTCGGRCGGTRKYWKIQAHRKVCKERTLRNKSKIIKRYMKHGIFEIIDSMRESPPR